MRPTNPIVDARSHPPGEGPPSTELGCGPSPAEQRMLGLRLTRRGALGAGLLGLVVGSSIVGSARPLPAFAAGYPGAGATLGPIMTMAYLLGRTASGASIGDLSLADGAGAR